MPESLDIRITQDYTGLLYTGTPLTLRCSLNLTAIDTNITVYSQWISTSQNANIQTDSRLTQSLTEISANAYESVLTFNPLDSLVDDGEYICLFTVSTDDVVTDDRTGNASIQLSVNGMSCNLNFKCHYKVLYYALFVIILLMYNLYFSRCSSFICQSCPN